MLNNRFFKNTWIYFLLILGYVLLYSVDVEHVIYPSKEGEVKSKVDFVYQQF
ncbi:MAG: hypothetical protein V4622_12740 [Bacteroidota bacterium]